jgi:hypothetical protein
MWMSGPRSILFEHVRLLRFCGVACSLSVGEVLGRYLLAI